MTFHNALLFRKIQFDNKLDKKRNTIFFLLQCLLVVAGMVACSGKNENKTTIDLAGEWDFQVDSLDKGINEKWYTLSLNDKIHLPGSMLTNGKGDEITVNTKWTGGIWDS